MNKKEIVVQRLPRVFGNLISTKIWVYVYAYILYKYMFQRNFNAPSFVHKAKFYSGKLTHCAKVTIQVVVMLTQGYVSLRTVLKKQVNLCRIFPFRCTTEKK